MKNILVLFLIMAGFIVPKISYSQGGGGPCPGDYPEICAPVCAGCVDVEDCLWCIDQNQDDTDVPIDGGLSWLLLAGAGLAGNHIRKKRKKRSDGAVVK